MTHQPPRRPDRSDFGSSRADRADRAERAERASHADARPLPQEIYTRRRVAAVAVILAVAALVVWGLTAFARSGGDDEAPETPAPASSTLVTTPTEPNPDGSDAASSETDATAAETTSTDANAKSSDAAATEDGEPSTGASETDKPDAEALAAKKTCELEDLQLTT